MRYLWIAAIGAAIVGGPVAAKPAPKRVPIPKEFPNVLAVPPPPMILTMPPPAPPVPPPPPAPYVRAPSPKRNPGYWVTTNDYPSAALREEISGVTRFRAIVGPDGRVSDCEVIQTSGSDILDAATCRLIVRRARFNPALDEGGNPTSGYYTTNVRWMIPLDLPPEPGTLTESYVVEADGALSNCRVKSQDGEDTSGPGACPAETMDGSFKDTAGKPVARRVLVKYQVTIANAPSGTDARPPAPRAWRGTNELPIAGTRATEVIVETDGTVSDCRIVKLTGPIAAQVKLGTNDCPKRYERGYAAANGELVRTLVRMTETTVIAPVDKRR